MHFYEQKFAYLIFLLYLCPAKVWQNQLLTNKFKIMKKILTLFTALILFGSMTVVQATDYYYKGNQTGWGDADAVKLTPSTDGYYAYFAAQSNTNLGDDNKFKIALSASSWDYSCYYADPGFNNTDITEMNNSTNTSSYSNGDWNNVVHSTVDFYI